MTIASLLGFPPRVVDLRQEPHSHKVEPLDDPAWLVRLSWAPLCAAGAVAWAMALGMLAIVVGVW